MKSVFRYPKTFVGLFVFSALLVVKYQNCAPTSSLIGGSSLASEGTNNSAPFPTGNWNGSTSSSITGVSLNLSGSAPQFMFPTTQLTATVTVQGTSSFNVEAGVIQNGQRAYFNQCTGSASGTGTVTQNCTFEPGTMGYPTSVSGNQNQITVPMFVTVVDSSGNVLTDCTSVSGVCSGNAFSVTATSFPIGYQVGSNCYHLVFTGNTFAMSKSDATFYVNNPNAMAAGFGGCTTSSSCCDTSNRCFDTSGSYAGTAPNSCL